MKRLLFRCFLLALSSVIADAAFARPQQSASVPAESNLISVNGTSAAAAGAPAHVFAFAVSTKSAEARKLVETAIDQYENVLLDRSVGSARLAAQKDPQFALAYAVWSFAARRTQPDLQALRKAEVLSANSPADEKLLVDFLTSTQK